VGFVALAVVPVLGLNSLATADTGDTGGASATDGQRHPRPALTDAQRQCLSEQGVTLPTRPADGTRPPQLTEEQRAALRAAAATCGLPTPPPGRGPRPALTDAQRQCLSEQGVTLPIRPADGTRPPQLTEEQRAALRAAAEACGLPTGPRAARVATRV
jgi:hypothetical protein